MDDAQWFGNEIAQGLLWRVVVGQCVFCVSMCVLNSVYLCTHRNKMMQKRRQRNKNKQTPGVYILTYNSPNLKRRDVILLISSGENTCLKNLGSLKNAEHFKMQYMQRMSTYISPEALYF